MRRVVSKDHEAGKLVVLSETMNGPSGRMALLFLFSSSEENVRNGLYSF